MHLKPILSLAIRLTVFINILLITAPSFAGQKIERAPAKQFYELVVYHVKDKSQEERIDKYLSGAFLPAVHRYGIKMVGVFKTANIDTATDKKIYVLLLGTDKELAAQGKEYVEATFDNAPYIRKESILMESFSGMPILRKPQFTNAKSERVYELRSYESATEKLYRNKLSMFNDGNEMAIFDRIGSQAVFYGEVLAGSHMPNLMYMTTYSDKKSRDEHWKAFGSDPDWKKLSAMPEYQHNVAKVNIEFLVPAEYSDL
jgi:hypothetical protein